MGSLMTHEIMIKVNDKDEEEGKKKKKITIALKSFTQDEEIN